ncbi:MAG: hypothetical protein MZW92_69570, partial [Comamonadaceae bacterium]|nr:hypothetical protein [Comamonadaceae bacterium]
MRSSGDGQGPHDETRPTRLSRRYADVPPPFAGAGRRRCRRGHAAAGDARRQPDEVALAHQLVLRGGGLGAARAGLPAARQRWARLFNCFYEGLGRATRVRGARILSQPTVAEVLDVREAVDARCCRFRLPRHLTTPAIR